MNHDRQEAKQGHNLKDNTFRFIGLNMHCKMTYCESPSQGEMIQPHFAFFKLLLTEKLAVLHISVCLISNRTFSVSDFLTVTPSLLPPSKSFSLFIQE